MFIMSSNHYVKAHNRYKVIQWLKGIKKSLYDYLDFNDLEFKDY